MRAAKVERELGRPVAMNSSIAEEFFLPGSLLMKSPFSNGARSAGSSPSARSDVQVTDSYDRLDWRNFLVGSGMT